MCNYKRFSSKTYENFAEHLALLVISDYMTITEDASILRTCRTKNLLFYVKLLIHDRDVTCIPTLSHSI